MTLTHRVTETNLLPQLCVEHVFSLAGAHGRLRHTTPIACHSFPGDHKSKAYSYVLLLQRAGHSNSVSLFMVGTEVIIQGHMTSDSVHFAESTELVTGQAGAKVVF